MQQQRSVATPTGRHVKVQFAVASALRTWLWLCRPLKQPLLIKTLNTPLIHISIFLQVNDVNFENMSNDDAVRILREIVSKPG